MTEVYITLKETAEMFTHRAILDIQRNNREILAEVQAENGNSIRAKVGMEFAKENYDRAFGNITAICSFAFRLLCIGILSKSEYNDLKAIIENCDTALLNARVPGSLWWAVLHIKG